MSNASEIITQVRSELNDPNKVTWSDVEMLSYINSAQYQIVLVRPDSYSVVENLLLTVSETKHSLASDALRLIDVIRNMGADGATPGAPIRIADMESMNLFDQGRHSDAGETTIRDVYYNEKTPSILYTDPPAHASTAVYIEIVVSKVPTDVADVDTGVLAIEDIYQQPIRQYMLHLAFAKETESISSSSKSRAYLQDFFNSLGVKTKVDKMYSPSKEVNPNG